MTAEVYCNQSQDLPLPGSEPSDSAQIITIRIRINLIIDQSRLAGVLSPDVAITWVQECWGTFSFADSNIGYDFSTIVTAHMGRESDVNATDMFVTYGNGRESESYFNTYNDRISHCRKRRAPESLPGMRVETDVIWIYDYPNNPGIGSFKHEVGHGLGIAHTASSSSVMRGEAPRGTEITQNDARCIINQLDFNTGRRQIIDSDAIGNDTLSSPDIMRQAFIPFPDRSRISPPAD